MSNKYFPIEYKYKVLMAYKDGDYTIKELCLRYQITKYTFYNWLEKFEKNGINGLRDSNTWKPYSKGLKEAAIRDYLSGKYSKNEIVRKYEISSRSVLSRWIKKYNSHRELKDTGKGRIRFMTKGRKTSWEERVQIAIHCLENGKDYHQTSEIYEVSYQQVYQWVRKYETEGSEALKDKRGRTKDEAELSPEEKIKLEMKKLERENERLRAENKYLKKLEEIERRRR